MQDLNEKLFQYMMRVLESMKNNPESITEKDKEKLDKLYSALCKAGNISEHGKWVVEWSVDKWHNLSEKISGVKPYETVLFGQNIITDTGANEMLKLISGTGGTAYNNSNTVIYVGTDSTTENASQTGVIATGNNRAYASVDSGYPQVSGRSIVYRASFDDDSANFAWNEAAVVNGVGASAVAMNRKVSAMGTKTSGTWTIQITISLVAS